MTDLLARRRPHRADAARNFDALLVAARDVFTERGTGASLDEIARRAGVGIGTLYRNFTTREELVESVYLAEVDALCHTAETLTGLEPWDALVSWLHQFAAYLGTKSVLIEGLNRESPALDDCRNALYAAGGPLAQRAQQAGLARRDVDIDDIMRFVIGITAVAVKDNEQRERLFNMALDGIHTR